MAKLMINDNKTRRQLRVRKKVFGTPERPRLSVYRSNKYIYGQIIDDTQGKTLVDVQKEATELSKKKNKTEASFEIGKELAKKAKEAKISKISFDRNGYKYHGRVKSFADGAREGGLEF